ncbi:MAG: hypothetical protein AAB544_04655 [Patescibacteria group bacterium]
MSLPQKLSKEEIQQQLFDALMEQIEPKLMTGARKQTAAELAAMEPEKRAEWMLYYQKAYEEFVDRWPEFVAGAIGETQNMANTLVEISDTSDKKRMQNLEQNFTDSSKAA